MSLQKMINDNFEHLDLTLGILKFCHWDVVLMNYNKGKQLCFCHGFGLLRRLYEFLTTPKSDLDLNYLKCFSFIFCVIYLFKS